MVKKKAVTIDKEDKFTQEEFTFLTKLLEKKKKGCGWVIDNWDDDKAVKYAMESSGVLSSILGKLELMREKIVG